MLPAFIGLALGLAGAMMLTRLLSSQLYEVRATDPFTFLVVGTTLLVVAVAACVLPACRAAHVDPIVALRYE
jgi:ABC-type antimicrobial peptide transport system permease subunit